MGVYKRLIGAWIRWIGPWRLCANAIAQISERLHMLRASCPSDFNRKPKSWLELPFVKGTEFRRSLLYDGLLVFRGVLDNNVYQHFLLLHCGIYILNSSVYYNTKNDLTKEMLRLFITHSIAIYGRMFVVYNVHSMSHLGEECAQHGPMDTFSAFAFENRLKSLKQSLKSGFKPLAAVIDSHDCAERLSTCSQSMLSISTLELLTARTVYKVEKTIRSLDCD
ncbi:hypothetical protein FOCC_FOCC002078 [Frankliniella occidentalis]|nr:hypothetical protein FOCC_FOCC002078 [Frankliniella occidentalis]